MPAVESVERVRRCNPLARLQEHPGKHVALNVKDREIRRWRAIGPCMVVRTFRRSACVSGFADSSSYKDACDEVRLTKEEGKSKKRANGCVRRQTFQFD